MPEQDAALQEAPLRAAVAAVFRSGERHGPELLFIRRAVKQGDPWSGHVAFPGGRVEPTDAGPLAAAMRESREEVGLELEACGRLLGMLPMHLTLPIKGRVTGVRPFVFALRQEPGLALNREVAAVFWVPLQDLADRVGRGTMTWRWKGRELPLPCVRIQGELIWGLTLRMVDDLLWRWEG